MHDEKIANLEWVRYGMTRWQEGGLMNSDVDGTKIGKEKNLEKSEKMQMLNTKGNNSVSSEIRNRVVLVTNLYSRRTKTVLVLFN